MGKRRVAYVTCAELPDGDADDRLALIPLADRDVDVDVVVWDDRSVNWADYDLVVVRSSWDYTRRPAEFLRWAASVPRLANGIEVFRWNSDKRYLRDLAAAGVPTIPTTYLEPGDAAAMPTSGQFVVKPSVGAGSNEVGRYDAADPEQLRAARKHADRLLTAGSCVLVQPYLSAVEQRGETALLYFGGEFSHAIEKGAMLAGEPSSRRSLTDGLYHKEHIRSRTATAAERAVGQRVLTALSAGLGSESRSSKSEWSPSGSPTVETPLSETPLSGTPLSGTPLYARVDLLAGTDGPVVLELELIEPSLFLGYADGAAERLADAIVASLDAGSVPADDAVPSTG